MQSKDTLEYFNKLKPIPLKGKARLYNVSIPEAIKYITLNYNWVEFGVYRGISSKLILKHLPQDKNLYLFDSFKGLPTDWKFFSNRHRRKIIIKKDYHKMIPDKIPKFNDSRTKMYIGWFKDSLPSYIYKVNKPFAFIHIDCDVYESTKDIFDNINHLIKRGTIILFDEYYNYEDWKQHEYKAFMEYIKKFNRKFEYLFRTKDYQACVRITE